MIKNLLKIGLFSMLIVGYLNASDYTAYVGCKFGKNIYNAKWCIKKIKVNGRYNYNFMYQNSDGAFALDLDEHFLIEVKGQPKTDHIKFLKIVDKDNNEVYYNESTGDYVHFKVEN